MWVLILTLAGLGNTGPAVATAPGFVSKEACVAAGDEWLKQMQDLPSYYRRTALCVPIAK